MADVHLPRLDEPEADGPGQEDDADRSNAGEAPAPRTRRSHGRGIGRILLEVLLISVGVFLGLAGEQWRETARHRELAQASLRRFRAEIAANRQAVTSVKDYHVRFQAALTRYFAADPKRPRALDFTMAGFQPAAFEHAAWDLALATQSLTNIDSDLGLALTHAYALQDTYAAHTAGLVNAMYVHPPGDPQDPEGFFRALRVYYGDVLVYEPALLKMYDELLPQIDRELGNREGR